MGKLMLMTAAFVLWVSVPVHSQTKLSYIKSKIHTHLSSEAFEHKFNGDVAITDVEEKDNYMIISGTFSFTHINMFGFEGSTVNEKFKAKVKVVLDDIVINKLCYVDFRSIYEDSCPCTDGSEAKVDGHKVHLDDGTVWSSSPDEL